MTDFSLAHSQPEAAIAPFQILSAPTDTRATDNVAATLERLLSHPDYARPSDLAADGAAWLEIHRQWQLAIDGAGGIPAPLFLKLTTESGCNDANAPAGGWWLGARVRQTLTRVQNVRHGIFQQMGQYDHCLKDTGIKSIFAMLNAWRHDPLAVSAVLCIASLHARLRDEGGHMLQATAETRASFDACRQIHIRATRYLRLLPNALEIMLWPTAQQALPEPVRTYPEPLDLIATLAAEHVALLEKWVLVDIETRASTGDKDVANHRVKMDRKRALSAKRREKDATERAALRGNRPIDWSTLSDADLKALVWEYPTRQLSIVLGVSDVAIGKRCKRAGISKPPRGYWSIKAASEDLPLNRRPTA